MKTNEYFTSNIGNPLFCNFETALAYASSVDTSLLKKVLMRPDASPSIVLNYIANDKLSQSLMSSDLKDCLNKEDVIQYLNNLNCEDFYHYAKNCNKWFVWEKLLLEQRKIDYLSRNSVQALLQIIIQIDEENISNLAFEKLSIEKRFASELDYSEAIKCAATINHWMVWRLALARLDVPLELALERAKNINNYKVWISVLTRQDLKGSDALKMANKIGDMDINNAVISRPDISKSDSIEYARKGKARWTYILEKQCFSADEIIDLIRKYNLGLKCMEIAINKPGVSFESAINYLKEASFNMSVLLSRPDFEEKFSAMSFHNALITAREISSPRSWNLIFARPDIDVEKSLDIIKTTDADSKVLISNHVFIKYLSSLTANEAIALGAKYDISYLWISILKRDDLSAAMKLKRAQELKLYYLWQSVISDEKVLEYLETRLYSERLQFAKDVDSSVVWDAILGSRSMMNILLVELKPKEAIEFAIRWDCPPIYDVICTRADVKQYLNSNKQ